MKFGDNPMGNLKSYQKNLAFVDSIVSTQSDNQDLKFWCDTFQGAKVFEIDDKITELFIQTKNKARKGVKLPFPVIFLDMNFEYIDKNGKKETIYGILLCENQLLEEYSDGSCQYKWRDSDNIKGAGEIGNDIALFSLGQLSDMSGDIDFTFNKGEMFRKSYDPRSICGKREFSRLVNQLIQISTNFIDFMNMPDMEMVEHNRSDKTNAKRKKKGKRPLPSTTVIKVKGKTKRYLDDLKTRTNSPYSHRFDVCGTYVHFYNQDRYKRIYALSNKELRVEGYQKDPNTGIISKWRRPFEKGNGIKIHKLYELESEV